MDKNKTKKINKGKFKKIVKYIVNGLNLANFIVLGLTQIWNIPYGIEISKTIVVVTAGISTYLLSSKAKEHYLTKKEEK